MQKRTSFRTLLAGVALIGSATACDSFLDPKPNDVLAPENFYKSSADAVAAVNGIYEQTKWAYWLGYWYMTDVATDDVIASPNFGSDGHRMSNYTTDPSEWVFGDDWGNRYTTINRSNAVIDRVPAIQMDPALRTRLVAEAHFLRALAYFDLVRFFGDVPLIEHEVTSLKNLDIARTPAAEIYALIVSDLQAAAAALPSSYTGSDIGRVTSGAALALLTKVYLQQKNYASAATTASQLIATNRYTLNPRWKDNFTVARELTNPESIFELNYDGTLDPGAGSVMTLFSLPASYPGGDAYGLMQVAPSLVALYDTTRDQRGSRGTFMKSPYTDAAGRKVSWGVPAGAAFDKYLDETSSQNMTGRAWASQSNNWVVLRYADVLLMYAEAVNEGGTAGSLSKEAAFNLVRQRAGLLPVTGLSQAIFRDSLRVDRRREFVFEGQRWFDLQRYGTLDAVIRAKTAEVAALFPGETTVHGVPSLVFPIPQSELDINPKLTQNQGW